MDDVVYRNVPLDRALLPDPAAPLLPTENIPNAGLGGLTIIQQVKQDNPIILTTSAAYDVAAPKDGSFLLAEGTWSASPLLSVQLPYSSPGAALVARAFYDRQAGNIRFFNDSAPTSLSITYQLFRIDGKVGSS
jgi:hypothetical protein